MRLTNKFLPGDRVLWTARKGETWAGAVVRVIADDLTVIVRWDSSGKETAAPAWSRRLRREVTCWAGDTLTQPEGW